MSLWLALEQLRPQSGIRQSRWISPLIRTPNMPQLWSHFRPFKGHGCSCRERIHKRLRAIPAHFERATARPTIMGNHNLGAIGIFEGHIGETTERVCRDMVGFRYNELAEMTKQVIVVRVGHVSR